MLSISHRLPILRSCAGHILRHEDNGGRGAEKGDGGLCEGLETVNNYYQMTELPMRLQHIRVTKLFGVFDHAIPVRLNDRITIIHGPNGFGKTAILQMVEALLTNQFSTFRRVPFNTFSITFDGGTELQVTKSIRPKGENEKENSQTSLKLEFREASKPPQEHTIDVTTPRARSQFPLEFIEHRIEGLERIAPEMWLQVQTGRRLDFDDVMDLYGEFLPGRGPGPRELPQWLAEFPKQFDVRLIEAQRLINMSGRNRRSSRPESQLSFEPAVASYSRELAGRIQENQARYGTFSQQLDSTFPTRVLQKKQHGSATVNELLAKLHVLEERRQRIIQAGLLTKDPNTHSLVDPERQVDESTKGILSLYAEDVENKLGVFSDITAKIELFKELVNKRFTYKQLDVERQDGFQLSSTNGLPLLPTDLSSGEQHELVLLYELLFRTKPNALILIDEPELSLHVAWQVEFLKDLEKVIKLSSFDVILATHSPQIINNRWDLTQELQGPQA
jgi:predicted ATP-dependent endonuclease of OLD family